MTTQTFYRLHNDHNGTRPLTADNAWSAPWGSEFAADGSAYTCIACDGSGQGPEEVHESCDGAGCDHCDNGLYSDCGDCEGEGTIDCERGYSCCEDARSLVAYFAQQHVTVTDGMGQVLVFEGEYSGNGDDGEALAVPARVVETLTWSELVKRAEAEESE